MGLTVEQLRQREGKLCVACGVPLVQRAGEPAYAFGRRKACDRKCGNLYLTRRRDALSQDPRWNLKRFEARLIPEPNSGCWLWLGATVPDGYGSFGFTAAAKSGSVKAHRAAWILYRGALPTQAHVLHKCDNRLCVNPDHLFLGDNDSNVADRVTKRRSACSGLTEAQVAEIISDPRSQASVARDHGVSQTTVWRIRNGMTKQYEATPC